MKKSIFILALFILSTNACKKETTNIDSHFSKSDFTNSYWIGILLDFNRVYKYHDNTIPDKTDSFISHLLTPTDIMFTDTTIHFIYYPNDTTQIIDQYHYIIFQDSLLFNEKNLPQKNNNEMGYKLSWEGTNLTLKYVRRAEFENRGYDLLTTEITHFAKVR